MAGRLLSGCVGSASDYEVAFVVGEFAPGVVDAEVEVGVGGGSEGEGRPDGEGGAEFPIAVGIADEESSEELAEGLAAVVAGADAVGLADPGAGGVAEDDAALGLKGAGLLRDEGPEGELPPAIGGELEFLAGCEWGKRGGGKFDGGACAVPAIVEFLREEFPFGFEFDGEEFIEVGSSGRGSAPVFQPASKDGVIARVLIDEAEETPGPGVGGEFLEVA